MVTPVLDAFLRFLLISYNFPVTGAKDELLIFTVFGFNVVSTSDIVAVDSTV